MILNQNRANQSASYNTSLLLFTALAIVVALAKQNKVIVTYSNDFSSNKNKALIQKKRVRPSPNSYSSSFELYKTKDNKHFYQTHTETMCHSMSGTFPKEDDIVTTIINFSIDLSTIGYKSDGEKYYYQLKQYPKHHNHLQIIITI